jgi:hypothetical protein
MVLLSMPASLANAQITDQAAREKAQSIVQKLTIFDLGSS